MDESACQPISICRTCRRSSGAADQGETSNGFGINRHQQETAAAVLRIFINIMNRNGGTFERPVRTLHSRGHVTLKGGAAARQGAGGAIYPVSKQGGTQAEIHKESGVPLGPTQTGLSAKASHLHSAYLISCL